MKSLSLRSRAGKKRSFSLPNRIQAPLRSGLKPRRSFFHSTEGFTLLELILALGVSTILLGSLGAVQLLMTRQFSLMNGSIDLTSLVADINMAVSNAQSSAGVSSCAVALATELALQQTTSTILPINRANMITARIDQSNIPPLPADIILYDPLGNPLLWGAGLLPPGQTTPKTYGGLVIQSFQLLTGTASNLAGAKTTYGANYWSGGYVYNEYQAYISVSATLVSDYAANRGTVVNPSSPTHKVFRWMSRPMLVTANRSAGTLFNCSGLSVLPPVLPLCPSGSALLGNLWSPFSRSFTCAPVCCNTASSNSTQSPAYGGMNVFQCDQAAPCP